MTAMHITVWQKVKMWPLEQRLKSDGHYNPSTPVFQIKGKHKNTACIDPTSEGTRWRSWLRHCATNRKVAGSIPDGVTAILQWLNPSGRIVVLGSTQPLTEMSIPGILPGGKDGQCVGLTTLPPSCVDCLEILGASTSWNPKGLSRRVAGKLKKNRSNINLGSTWRWVSCLSPVLLLKHPP
jgi:hypothetical protein